MMIYLKIVYIEGTDYFKFETQLEAFAFLFDEEIINFTLSDIAFEEIPLECYKLLKRKENVQN